ncbi:MAG: hypothetical protein KGS44_10495 [Alphaproteobacteria bacterium]|nr:hypothetical protein [Alphaproteobacteria bacterium]
MTESTAAPARSQAAGDSDAQARPELRSSKKEQERDRAHLALDGALTVTMG